MHRAQRQDSMEQHSACRRRHSRPTNRASADDRGFTLVEVLISIVLVGILAAVVVLGVGGLVGKGKASACTADRSALNVAVRAYLTVNGVTQIPFNTTTGVTPGDTLHNVGLTDKVSTMYAVQPDGTLNAITGNADGCVTDVMAAAPTTVAVAPFQLPPGDFKAVAASGQATFTWSAATTAGYGPITFYYIGTNPSNGPGCRVEVTQPLTCTVTGLVNGTTYRYFIQSNTAHGATGGTSLVVRPSATNPTVTDSIFPTAPTNVTAASVAGSGTATISWTASTTGGDFPVAKYTVQKYSGGSFTTCSVAPPALSCTVTGLQPGVTYNFGVGVENTAGDSTGSGGLGATVVG